MLAPMSERLGYICSMYSTRSHSDGLQSWKRPEKLSAWMRVLGGYDLNHLPIMLGLRML